MQITSCEIANSKYIQIYLTEEELEKQIKNKLYQKGYNLSEINEFLSTK